MRKKCISLVKRSVNNLNPTTLEEQLAALAKRSIGKTFAKFKWVFSITSPKSTDTDKGHEYTGQVCFAKKQQREREESSEVFDKQFTDIAARMASFSKAAGWELAEKQEEGVAAALKKMVHDQQRTVVLPENDDISKTKFFAHLFGRQAQIRVIWDTIRATVDSGFKRRAHVCCYGPAGCGKTTALEAFQEVVGQQNCLRFNAESTSKAGMENELLEYVGDIPRFIIIEEIEKVNPANLACLLSVMDERARLKKVNAKVGSIEREVRSLVLGTVNDMKLFKSVLSGAIASRFSHKLYFPRPDESLLARILNREVVNMKGDPRWIKPVMEFMKDEGETDPRRGIALLDGRGRILDKSYFKDQREMLRQRQKDEAAEAAALAAMTPKP